MKKFFKKIFGGRQSPPEIESSREIPTIPVVSEKPVEPETPTEIQPDVQLPQSIVGCGQSVGKQRDHNEDSLFTMTTVVATNGSYLPLGLYIVADGMGGHQHGEVASGLAVRTVAQQVIRKVFISLLAARPSPPEESLQEILEFSLQEAHQMVSKEAPGSGTTLTAVLIVDRQMTIAHVGDSRAYAIALDGSAQILTRDHSLVMRMLELNQITEEEAAIHPQRNVLYRALGQGDQFTADISSTPLPTDGYLLLCSDGLWGVVNHEDLIGIVTKTPIPQVACQLLVDAANEAGGPDNISAILVKLPG